MAYAFDRVLNAMGRKKDEPGQANMGGREAPGLSQANVFGREAPQSGGGTPDRIRASSSEGALPQAGGAAPSAQQNGPAPAGQAPASRARIFQANAGKVQSPVDLSAMGQQIQRADQGLQGEANKYVSNATKPYASVDDGTKAEIREFAGLRSPGAPAGVEPLPLPPGEEHLSNPSPYLPWQDAFTQGPGQLKGFDSQVNTNIGNADMLGTDAGIQELFRRQGSAEYSAGDAAFDASLLRKNSAFNTLRDQTLAQNEALQKRAGTIGEETNRRAQEEVGKAYGGWKRGVETELDGALGEIQRGAEGTEAQFDQNLTSQRQKELARSGKRANEVISRLRDENPELSTNLRHAEYDPNTYMDVGGPTADDTRWQDFLGIPQANSFNKVMSILGRGGEAYLPGQYAGRNYSDVLKPRFDNSRFASDMLQQANDMGIIVKEKGRVDAPSPVNPTTSPKGPNAPQPVGPIPPGTVGVNTSGEGVTDIGGASTPVDPNSVPVEGPVGAGNVALDTGDSGPSGGGSVVNTNGAATPTGVGGPLAPGPAGQFPEPENPWWVPEEDDVNVGLFPGVMSMMRS